MTVIGAMLLSASQDIGNPEYARWAKLRVGPWVNIKSEKENEGNKMVLPTETTHTLPEIDVTKAVVEDLTLNTLQPKGSPKQERSKNRTSQVTSRKKDASPAEGDEETQIAGKKLAGRRTRIKGASGRVKTWIHPGVSGVVRLEVGLPSKRIQRLSATAWEKK
jgi:hypothetical protein